MVNCFVCEVAVDGLDSVSGGVFCLRKTSTDNSLTLLLISIKLSDLELEEVSSFTTDGFALDSSSMKFATDVAINSSFSLLPLMAVALFEFSAETSLLWCEITLGTTILAAWLEETFPINFASMTSSPLDVSIFTSFMFIVTFVLDLIGCLLILLQP